MAGEEELVRKAALGDTNALGALYDRYAPSLLSLCLRYCGTKGDAEDVLHEGFIRILKALPRFRYTQEGSLRAWMKRIMVNAALNSLRNSLRTRTLAVQGADLPHPDPDDTGEDLLSLLSDRISQKEILRMITSLPPGYRTVFNLYVFEEYSHKEIAQALHCSENTSKSQLSKARALLRKQLTEFVQKDLLTYEKEQPSY